VIAGCPNAADIGITYGYIGPANPQATVVFFSGGDGTTPTQSGDDIATYAPVYEGNFEIVQVEYQTPWEDPSSNGTGGNILNAACRPATFLNYIHNNSGLLKKNTMCAQGESAGASAIAYSITWFGQASLLTNIELLSGPVLSAIDDGCTYPNKYQSHVCNGSSYCSKKTNPWYSNIIYVPPYNVSVSSWSGIPQVYSLSSGFCGTLAMNPIDVPLWQPMGIVDGSAAGVTPTFNFPGITKHGWLCSTTGQTNCGTTSCPNNSPSQGKVFYDAITDSNLVVTGVTGCKGAEGVASGN
jgi:hypothetical protein